MSSRLPVSTSTSTRVINTVPAQRPPFRIPRAPPAQWTPDTLIPYVKTAMMIELGTIPLYLYSMYSIQPDDGKLGTQARTAIRGIVEQEMLHLSLTGNLLCALGGSMDLYDYDVIPQYPGHILVQKIEMNLDRANKENLECFLQIEAPDTPRPQPDNNEPGLLPDKPASHRALLSTKVRADIAPEYKSIGDFYEDLAKGLKDLPDSDFAHNTDNQFSGLDFFNDQMVVIKDQASALKAVATIIEQGEGNVAVPDCHYAVFVKLYLNREAWTLLELPKNPQTKDYKDIYTTNSEGKSKRFISVVSTLFDAGYCYLLQTIQRVWQTGREPDKILLRLLLLRNVHAIMTDLLTPVANILIQQKLNTDNSLVAAPCFNYYPLKEDGTRHLKEDGTPEDPMTPKRLHEALRRLALFAAAASPTSDVRKVFVQLEQYIKNKIQYE